MGTVFDPRRLVPRDPKSPTGEAIQVVGYSVGSLMVIHRAGCGMAPLRGRSIAAYVAIKSGRGARMADKGLAGRIAVTVE